MSRPHTCFIQAQMLPWRPGPRGAGRRDVECKLLSIDDTDGSCTSIVRYPPNWQRTTPEHCGCHEEFLVLDGWIEINGQRYDRQCYGFLPANYLRHTARTSEGAVLLTMYYGEPVYRSTPNQSSHDPKLLVEYVNPLLMPWDESLVDPQLAKGVAIKPLRTDPYTQEVSFLYCSPPHRVPAGMAKPQWTHPMVEELYVLEGDYVWADLGRMRPGGYCWWREQVYHGPSGTDTGYHLFVRTIGGPLVNIFGTEKKPHTWAPAHRPVLPPELSPYGQPLPRVPNY